MFSVFDMCIVNKNNRVLIKQRWVQRTNWQNGFAWYAFVGENIYRKSIINPCVHSISDILTILSRFKWIIGRLFYLFDFFVFSVLHAICCVCKCDVSLLSKSALGCCLFSMQCTDNYHSQNNWMWFFLFKKKRKRRRRSKTEIRSMNVCICIRIVFACDDDDDENGEWYR